MTQPPMGPPPQGPPPQGPPPSFGGPPPPGGPTYPSPGGGGVNGKALAVIIAAIVLVVGGIVTAVAVVSGDDDDSADDIDSGGSASVEEFCDVFTGLASGMIDRVDLGDSEEEQGGVMVEVLNEWAAEMEDVGVPEGMSDEARDGLELIVETAADLEPGDIQALSDLERLEESFSDDEQEAVTAFEEYAADNCETSIDDLPSVEAPTDLPSEIPTGLPTELPSDFLTMLPSDYLTMIPSEYLTMIPSEYLTMKPSDFLTMMPSDFPTE